MAPTTKRAAPTDDKLSVGIQSRISPQALALLQKQSRAAGVKQATWIRNAVYQKLGLLASRR
jgi:hypothetical protein